MACAEVPVLFLFLTLPPITVKNRFCVQILVFGHDFVDKVENGGRESPGKGQSKV